jgi:hypothetical protein
MAALIVCKYRHFKKLFFGRHCKGVANTFLPSKQNTKFVFILNELNQNWKDYYSWEIKIKSNQKFKKKMLKGAQVSDFLSLVFTLTKPIRWGNLGTGGKNYLEYWRSYFLFIFFAQAIGALKNFYACWVCTNQFFSHAERAHKKLFTHGEHREKKFTHSESVLIHQPSINTLW